MITAALRISLRGSFCPQLAWIFNHRPGQLQSRLYSIYLFCREGQKGYLRRPSLLQGLSAGRGRASGRVEIVEEQHPSALDLPGKAAVQQEPSPHVFLPFLRRQTPHGPGIRRPDQGTLQTGLVQPPSQMPPDQSRLVEAPLPFLVPVQRHRHDQIEIQTPVQLCQRQPVRADLGQIPGDPGLPVVLE